MLVAAAVADLDQAQPVAQRVQPHGLGVDGDRTRGQHAFGQVFFVEMDGHQRALGEAARPLTDWFSRAPASSKSVANEIGRESSRERASQYGETAVGGGSLKKKKLK